MAKIPLISKSEAEGEIRAFYDEIEEWLRPFPGPRAGGSMVPQPWRAFAYSPTVGRLIFQGSKFFLSDWKWGQDNIRLRQLAILAATKSLGCEFAFVGHWPIAEKVGISRAQYEAFEDIDSAKVSVLFDEEQRLIITFAHELTVKANVGAEIFNDVATRYGNQVAVELTMLVAWRKMTSTILNALEIRDD